jgi:copper chaperone CopZ
MKWFLLIALATMLHAADSNEDAYRPHTPTLTFHLTQADEPADAEAIRASVQKVASVLKITFVKSTVQVRFDSHVVSYHQVAQAIAEAGTSRGKTFDPHLKIIVPDYAKADNAIKVDAIFTGKRLNQRVSIKPCDRTRGEFFIHFLPLTVDPADKKPQGFNGGHLHHPIHDEPPRGLGLDCDYE